MTLTLDMRVELKEVRGQLMIQTILNNGAAVRFTLTVEQAEKLAHQLNAQVENARLAERSR